MKWKGTTVSLALTLVMCWATTASASLEVRFEPALSEVFVGDDFDVDIVLDTTDAVLGWGLDLTIQHPHKLHQLGSPAIGTDWTVVFAPDGDELAGLAPLANPEGITGYSVLATVTFHADQQGWVPFYLTDDWPVDESEGFALYPTGMGDPDYRVGRIHIIPEPAALGLLLLGAGTLRRRRQARVS